MQGDYSPQQLLNQKQAANLLGASEKTLEGWRVKGGGPRFLKQGSRFIRYRMSDLSEWIEGHLVDSTSEYETASA